MKTVSGKPTISIIIPAYNEAEGLEISVNSVLYALDGRFSAYEVIIVNDGSSDSTQQVAEQIAAKDKNIKVLQHQKNQGMGQSLLDGFNAATMDYLGSFPGDNGLDKDSLADMFDLVGKADMVSYFIANPGFRSRFRQFVSWFFVQLINIAFGLTKPYYTGHAIYRRDHYRTIPHTTAGHAFLTETLIRLLKKGYTCVTIGTMQNDRTHGKTKAFSLRNVFGVSKTMICLAWEMRGSRFSSVNTDRKASS